MPRAVSMAAKQCLVIGLLFSGASAARGELYRPFDARRDGRDAIQTHVPDIGRSITSKESDTAARWYLRLDEVADLDALLENRRVHGTYSTSHRATLISWAAYFDAAMPGGIPSTGNGLDRDDGLDENAGDIPGGNVGPNIPPVPSPNSAGLATIGCALLFLARRRLSARGV